MNNKLKSSNACLKVKEISNLTQAREASNDSEDISAEGKFIKKSTCYIHSYQ